MCEETFAFDEVGPDGLLRSTTSIAAERAALDEPAETDGELVVVRDCRKFITAIRASESGSRALAQRTALFVL